MLDALRLARQTGDPWSIAQLTLGLGRLAAERGDLPEARARCAEAAEQFRQLGDLSQANYARSDLARGLARQGQFAEASAIYRETLSAWASLGHRGALAQQMENLAFIDSALGQGARAARLLGAAERLREISHAARLTYQQPEYEQAVATLRAQLPAPEMDAAWAAGRGLGVDEAVAYALAG
jgi:tetratricopeptide (TPR) repeat protein